MVRNVKRNIEMIFYPMNFSPCRQMTSEMDEMEELTMKLVFVYRNDLFLGGKVPPILDLGVTSEMTLPCRLR